MGDVSALPAGTMLPVKEESPAGTGLSELPIFSGARGSAQSTPASTLSNVSRAMLTKPDIDMLVPSAVAATISSGGAILSDTMPTTPPYNPHSTPPPQYIDDADYISRHVAAAVAAETATPPEDEYMDDGGSNAESECPALEDESPYDALYRDSEFADDAVPSFTQPASKPTATTSLPEIDVDMTGTTPHEAETHIDSVSRANGARAENHGSDLSQVDGTTERSDNANEVTMPATSSDSTSPSQMTPSEDTIASRRPIRMARLSKPAAPESPKPARQTTKPAAKATESAPGPAPGAHDATAVTAPEGDVETPSAEVPVRRASKRVSLAAAAVAASPLAKQATTAAAKQAAKASPKPKDTPAKTAKEAPLQIERRATRQSGLPIDLAIPQPSPETTTASGKRRRRESEKAPEELPRELRRLQDTKEFTHVDDEPVVYTVWSNGRYVPCNAKGEPLVDKNAAKKAAKLAKAAEEAEKQKAAEEAAAAERKAAEEKAAAEAAVNKKRVKKWMVQGLYAGMPTPSNPAAGLTAAERKELSKLPELSKKYPPNKVLPMPIYNGLRSLIQGRDFKMPFDVFNPLPPGQPKPVKYGRFNKNRFVGEALAIWKKNPNYDDLNSKCVCKPENGCDEDCQNRIMLYECNDEICNVGSDRCSNREFQRLADRTASKNPYHIGVEVFKTQDRGHGIRASRAFRPGQIIMEYIGEIITEEESDRRMNELYKDNACYYLMSFDQSLIIDGTSGSIARFVNHSCSPNCRMIKWIVSGQPRIALFAGDRPIQTGEELTYDYNFDPYSAKNVQGCLCGADNCRGVLGPRKSEKAVSKAAAEKAAAEKKAKGGNGSAKRKHDAYSMDDDDTDAASGGPASKKMRVADAQVKSPARPVKKATKPPPPKKAVTTTKAALEAMAANAARIARLTKASHAARDARIAKAAAKRAAEAAAAAKAKRAKSAKASSKSTTSKASSSSSSKLVGKLVKAAKGVKVVKTPQGLKASKATVSKDLKSKTVKPTKPTKSAQAAKSPARKPVASAAKTSKTSKASKPAPKPAQKKTASSAAPKRAATPVSDDDNNAVSKPATPQSTHKATPMAQAVAKASKAAAAKAAIAAKKPVSTRRVSKIVNKAFVKAKVPLKPLPVKKAAAAAKKAGATRTPTTKITVETTTKITVAVTPDDTPAKRGRGRPRLVAKEPINVDAMDETPGNETVAEADKVVEDAATGLSAVAEADEEEQLAAQLATEAAANTSVFEDSALYDTTFDDSMMDDNVGNDDVPSRPEPRPRKPRLRKMSKAQKLREKRQLVAARRLAAKQDGSYVPKRGPGRPRKYVKISELQASIADTTMADDSSLAPTPASAVASSAAPSPALADTASASDAAGTPTPVARAAKAKIEYGVARRGDVEEFKAARARAKARMERMNGTSSDDENTAPAEQPAATMPTSTEDVIHVFPGERVPLQV